MIRRVVIAGLTVAALGTGALWVRSLLVRDRGVAKVMSIPSVGLELEHLDSCLILTHRIRSTRSPLCTHKRVVNPDGTVIESYSLNSAAMTEALHEFVLQLRIRTVCGIDYYTRPSEQVLILSAWVPAILFAVCPCWAVVAGPLCRWRRRRRGLCLTCGYDLTGNTSGRCPECGAAI